MRITVAASAGFCFGVKRALAIALETSRTHSKVSMLGDIVHNETVVTEVRRAGITKIRRLGRGATTTLLIRAHGAGRTTFREARRRGYTIVDATCPMVKGIHTIAQTLEHQGYAVIVIGDRNHDEVRGIIGQLNHPALVIDDSRRLPLARIKKLRRAAVIVQSTQDSEKALLIVERLKAHLKNLKFVNTICRPTRIKQEEIHRLPTKNDLMIILGSRSSANTKRLYQISRALNPRSYWINSPGELQPRWFKGVTTVGITAGASTPDSTTIAVVEAIKKLTRPTHRQ